MKFWLRKLKELDASLAEPTTVASGFEAQRHFLRGVLQIFDKR